MKKLFGTGALACVLFASLLVAFVSSNALADVPAPDTSGCNGKKAGDACTTDAKASGTCVAGTRKRPNFAARNDGGGPEMIEIPTMTCAASIGGAAPSASSGTTTPGSGGKGCNAGPYAPLPFDSIGIAIGALVLTRVTRKKSR